MMLLSLPEWSGQIILLRRYTTEAVKLTLPSGLKEIEKQNILHIFDFASIYSNSNLLDTNIHHPKTTLLRGQSQILEK